MNDHLDLVGLLRGELRTAEVVEAGEHLRTCAACRDELVDTAIGHSLLSRSGTALGDPAEQPALPLLPPLEPRPTRSRRTRALVAVAAAAVVAGLLGTGVAVVRSGGDPDGPTGPLTPAGQRIEASLVSPAVPGEVPGPGDGSVSMVEQDGRTRMSIAVHDLPRPAAGEYLYAWLLDPATDKMLPLGQVDPADGATFDLDESLVSSYSAVDVSLEVDDGDPAHSVTSLLRGSYDPSQITTQGRETS